MVYVRWFYPLVLSVLSVLLEYLFSNMHPLLILFSLLFLRLVERFYYVLLCVTIGSLFRLILSGGVYPHHLSHKVIHHPLFNDREPTPPVSLSVPLLMPHSETGEYTVARLQRRGNLY